jgi:hypothetical protein
MLNLAGPAYDFGPVLYAVLQECEHQRRALVPDRAEKRLGEIAREKLAEIRETYRESGGDPGYWRDLEREVLETAVPQYAPEAVEQTRLERTNYGVWRGGDPLARGAMGLGGLALGALIIALPLSPLLEDPFALLLAAFGFFYPEIRRLGADYRYSRLLNRLISQAEAYQKDQRLHYVSHARFDEALRTLAKREVFENVDAAKLSDPTVGGDHEDVAIKRVERRLPGRDPS